MDCWICGLLMGAVFGLKRVRVVSTVFGGNPGSSFIPRREVSGSGIIFFGLTRLYQA